MKTNRFFRGTFFLFFLVFGFCVTVSAENLQVSPTQRSIATSPEAIRLARFKQAARAKLVSKLTNSNGSSAKIYVLSPMNYTSLKETDIVNDTVRRSITAYDPKIDVSHTDYTLPSLTLEAFHKAIARLEADIIFVSVLNRGAFDIYLYDKRSPFQIYAHSEPIAGAAQYEMTKEAAGYYTKLLVRRTLYRYIKNQYYELPRDQSPTVLKSEIPRYIASRESLDVVNRESRAGLYAAVNLGAALSYGSTSGYWNSNLFSAQLGARLYHKLYFEAALDMFAYNGTVGSLRYIFSNPSSSFKASIGLGAGYIFSSRQTLNWDQSEGNLDKTAYVVPSFSVMLPIVDVYLKAESQVFIAVQGKARYLLTIMPGLLLMF